MLSRTLALGALLVLSPAVGAQESVAQGGGTSVPGVATASRIETDLRIDGLASEPEWQRARAISAFRQYSPEPDAPPSQHTDFRVLYDSRHLYLFVRAFDTHPDSILRALSRRDVRGPSDQIGVLIDSYADRRTGYSFYVNPDGVKRDQAIFDDGNEDPSWDGVWEVATRVDEEGWTAEFRIPLSQLRYADAESHTFGFGVRRIIERHNEALSWPLYSRTTAGLISQLGRLEGLRGLDAGRRLEAVPYLVTKNVTRAREGGGFEHPQEGTVGGDLKLGITPNVTLDATVNPDFGQVEADPAVLNLTAFETFLSERRPFFVEGTGLYSLPLNCYIVVDCSTNENLFYSRRIGRAPSLGSEYGGESTPEATPIAGAAKLTGRLPGGLSFGVLDAVTREVRGTQRRTVEPLANYTVIRAQQDLREGDMGFGFIATAVNRRLDEWTRAHLHESAYVAGATFRSRFGGRNYEVAGSFAASRVAGSQEAILATQRSSVHYYQQPGDDLEVDSTRTSLAGYAAQVKVGKYAGGITRFESSLVRQTGGFEVNDLGYLRRADILDWSTWAALSFQTPTTWYRWAQLNGNHWQHWNSSGLHLESALNFNGHIGLHNNWNFHLGGTLAGLGEVYCDRCTRGGPPLRESFGFYPWGGVNGDSRKPLVPGFWTNLAFFDEGNSHRVSLSPSLSWQVSTRFRSRLGLGFTRSVNDAQWFGNFQDEGDGPPLHYAFAHLDQRTVSLNLRINYAATPDLTFEFYGEPFTTSGDYSDVREVSDTPGARDYSDRFRPFTPPEDSAMSFRFNQLRTNTVIRWEYRPGSTLFLVWAHGRQGYLENLDREPWHRDVGDLFDLHPENTFLIKASYWMNW